MTMPSETETEAYTETESITIPETAPPPSGKVKKPASEADPRHSEFMKLWNDRFKACTGLDYAFNGGRDGNSLKRLLQATKEPTPSLVAIAERAWAKVKEDKFAKSSKEAATIHGFCTCFNQIRIEVGGGRQPAVQPQQRELMRGWGKDFLKGESNE
jgi:hypothetical protein